MIWDNRRVWRPAGLFGLEMLEVTRRQKVELEEAELKMLRFSLEEERAGGDTVRLRWFGRVKRRCWSKEAEDGDTRQEKNQEEVHDALGGEEEAEERKRRMMFFDCGEI